MTQVPLGTHLKGEQKYEEMIDVLSHLHQYVPTITSVNEVTIEGEDEPVKVIK